VAGAMAQPERTAAAAIRVKPTENVLRMGAPGQ